MQTLIPLERTWLMILICVLFVAPLQAENETQQSSLTLEQLKDVREKSLSLLRDIEPARSNCRPMETMAIGNSLVYWGNLFDPNQVVALVNLAPKRQPDDQWLSFERECQPCYLSLCVWQRDHWWEKAHWVYQQYLDNAHSLIFHDRKDSPHHFVQASRKTGRYEGDFLSWYYDPKSKTLIRTNFETWGPFCLVGNYLCTTRGYERRARESTTWIYAYNQGRKGDLLAIYDADVSRGEVRGYSITFRDFQTQKLWTYSFIPKETDPPYLNYSVDGAEGEVFEKVETLVHPIHYSANIKLSGEGEEPFDSFCFERLTRLKTTLEEVGDADWSDGNPAKPPVKEMKFEISGDSEIVRHLQNP